MNTVVRATLAGILVSAVACSGELQPTSPPNPAATASGNPDASGGTAAGPLPASYYGAGCFACALAPVLMERTTGAPTRRVFRFAALAQFEYRLVVHSSGPGSSVRVALNGEGIIDESDLAGQTQTAVTRTVRLTSGNELEVHLRGAPGTRVTLWIEPIPSYRDGLALIAQGADTVVAALRESREIFANFALRETGAHGRVLAHKAPDRDLRVVLLDERGLPTSTTAEGRTVSFANWSRSEAGVSVDVLWPSGDRTHTELPRELVDLYDHFVDGGSSEPAGLRASSVHVTGPQDLIRSPFEVASQFAGVARPLARASTRPPGYRAAEAFFWISVSDCIWAGQCASAAIGAARRLLSDVTSPLDDTWFGVAEVLASGWEAGLAQAVAVAAVGTAAGTAAVVAAAFAIPLAVGGIAATVYTEVAPAEVMLLSGMGQSAYVGQQLRNPLRAAVLSHKGVRLTNQWAKFVVETGGGRLANGESTDWVFLGSEGEAATTWTLGPVEGVQMVSFQSVSFATVGDVFLARAEAIPLPDPAVVVDDFSGTLSNWHLANAGSWRIDNGRLWGEYNIGCGSYSCSQSDFLLVDALQPGDSDWDAEVKFTEIRYTHSPGFDMTYAQATYSLYVSESEKMYVAFFWDTQNTPMPAQLEQLLVDVRRYPWGNVLGPGVVAVPTWQPSAWNTAVLQKRGDSYTMVFNGQPVHSFTATFSQPPKIGMHVYGRTLLDDFKLTKH